MVRLLVCSCLSLDSPDTTKDFEAQEMEILAEQEVEKPISAPNTPSAPPAPEGLYPILEDMCEPSPPPVPSAPTCPSSPGKVSTCPVTLNTRVRGQLHYTQHHMKIWYLCMSLFIWAPCQFCVRFACLGFTLSGCVEQ